MALAGRGAGRVLARDRRLADHLREGLVTAALEMAVARRRPRTGLSYHSDQGSQFVSLAFGQACGKAGDRALDGKPRRLLRQRRRRELLRHPQKGARPPPIVADPARTRGLVFEYIEVFYNPRRRHPTLGYLSPAEYEQREKETEIKIKEETT